LDVVVCFKVEKRSPAQTTPHAKKSKEKGEGREREGKGREGKGEKPLSRCSRSNQRVTSAK